MLRGLFHIVWIGILTVSCGSARRLATTESAKPIGKASVPTATTMGKRVYKGAKAIGSEPGINKTIYANSTFRGNVETSIQMQFKYALLIDVPVEALDNTTLLSYMDDWYGTPYRYGGASKKGIDCSAFTLGLMAVVFNRTVPRTVKEQFETTERIEKYDLQEGDLVFFNTRGGISHVGVYLLNNKFVHASVSNGVMISDLNEDYFVKRYIGAGRIKTNG